jgi:hypothetical protein
MTLIALDELIRTDKRDAAYYADDKQLKLIEESIAEYTQLTADLAAKDALLLEMFQALAGVLGDMEHRGAVRPVVHKACEDAICHWLEMTQPKEKK